jgi:hypothetical protein
MKVLARLFGFGMLGLVLFLLYHAVTDPPDLPINQPGQSAFAQPPEPGKPAVNLPSGERITFDEPMEVTLSPSSYAEFWACGGGYSVIDGPATKEHVCAVAFYKK